MSFVDRAKSMHSRGDAVRAAVILAQGLKREPTDVEAVGWLLHLYVEELPNPGIEADLLNVLALQPNGADLLAIVRAELAELGLAEKTKALEKTLELSSLEFHSTPPPAAEPAEPQQRAPSASSEMQSAALERGGENWDSFDSPFDQLTSNSGPAATRTAPDPATSSTEASSPSASKSAAPELADRALSASIDLALSQPLSAHDPGAAGGHHSAAGSGSGPSFGFWAVILGIAVICGILIIGYAQGSSDEESAAQDAAWEASGDEHGAEMAGSGAEAAPEDDGSAESEPSVQGSAAAPIDAPSDEEGR